MDGGGPEGGVCHSFSYFSSTFSGSHSHEFVLSVSRGRALERWEDPGSAAEGAVEPVSLSPGYYRHMFVVFKVFGCWKPIIDLSLLNHFVVKTRFHVETNQSVL